MTIMKTKIEYLNAVRTFCNEHKTDLTRNNRIYYYKDRSGNWVKDSTFKHTKRLMLDHLKAHGFKRSKLARFQRDAAQILKYSHEPPNWKAN